jgi:hypothetical protein
MPLKTGIQVVEELKKFYKSFNMDLEYRNTNLQIEEPLFVFITSYSTTNFSRLVRDIGVEYCYEKPI